MALPAEIVELWEDVTGGLLVEGYGLTETSPVASATRSADRRPGAVGVPFPTPTSASSTPTTRPGGPPASAASC